MKRSKIIVGLILLLSLVTMVVIKILVIERQNEVPIDSTKKSSVSSSSDLDTSDEQTTTDETETDETEIEIDSKGNTVYVYKNQDKEKENNKGVANTKSGNNSSQTSVKNPTKSNSTVTTKSNKTTTTTKSNKPVSTTRQNKDDHDDGPLVSSLKPIGGTSLYYRNNLTPAEFFVKTGDEYSNNEKIMNRFNISSYYSNKKATSSEIVAKSELVKVLSLLCDSEDTIIEYKNTESYKNEKYVFFANVKGYIKKNSITASNHTSPATKKELFNFLAAAFTVILNGDDYETLMDKYGVSYWQAYNLSTRDNFLRDCMNISGFGSYSADFFSDDPVNKGYLNEIVLKMCKEHAIIHHSSKYTGDDQIILNTSSMPKNYHLFPYIIKSIPNYVYEYPLSCRSINDFLAPYDLFKRRPELFGRGEEAVERYFKILLNVDYTTITVADFKDQVRRISVSMNQTSDLIEEYVKYVKDNKIKISGSAKCLAPIMYYDPECGGYFIRTRVKFNIISSNTDKGILFGGGGFKYSKTNYDVYIDAALELTLNAGLMVENKSFLDTSIKNSKGRNIGISIP